MPTRSRGPVFHDPHGRRERVLRWLARAGAIVSTVLGVALAAGLVIPPLLPRRAIGRERHTGDTARSPGTKTAPAGSGPRRRREVKPALSRYAG